MKKVWQETAWVTGYTHKHVVDDYNGEPVVERQEREICIKATAWFCAESGTYRLDSMTVIRIKDSSSWVVGVWDGETVSRHIEKMMPRVHLAAVEPYVEETDIIRDAITRIDIYRDAARRAFEKSDLDMSRISDDELIEQYHQDSLPY